MSSATFPPPRSTSRTRLLDAALTAIRARGYAATTVDDICMAAGVTKGSFFHHFKSKDDLAVAALAHWSTRADDLFGQAEYHRAPDPRDRLHGYLALRQALLHGDLPDVTCLAGTVVQETYGSHAPIREACERCIADHAAQLVPDIEEAKRLAAPGAGWTAESLALFTQAVIQGAFILAKAKGSTAVAADCLAHLDRYLAMLLPQPEPKA